jgi:hypothetical protein
MTSFSFPREVNGTVGRTLAIEIDATLLVGFFCSGHGLEMRTTRTCGRRARVRRPVHLHCFMRIAVESCAERFTVTARRCERRLVNGAEDDPKRGVCRLRLSARLRPSGYQLGVPRALAKSASASGVRAYMT